MKGHWGEKRLQAFQKGITVEKIISVNGKEASFLRRFLSVLEPLLGDKEELKT